MWKSISTNSGLPQDHLTKDNTMNQEEFKNLKERKIQSANKLKELGAPKEVVESELSYSKMTLSEFLKQSELEEKQHNTLKKKYIAANPIKKDIVDAIYQKSNVIEYQSITYTSFTYFLSKLNPLEFMSQDDFHYGIYDDFLKHAHELYREKHLHEMEKDHTV